MRPTFTTLTKRGISFLFLFSFSLSVTFGQAKEKKKRFDSTRPNSFRINHQFDFSVGEKDFNVAPNRRELIESKTWQHFMGFGKDKNVRFGIGARFSSYKAFDIAYATEKQDLKKNILQMPVAQQNNLVVLVAGSYRPLSFLEIGYNFDVLGYATAYVRPGTFIGNDSTVSTNANANTFCFSLLGAYNYGMTRTELYTSIYIYHRVVLRIGVTHTMSTYTTVKNKTDIVELQNGNSRFNRHFYTPFIALALCTNHN